MAKLKLATNWPKEIREKNDLEIDDGRVIERAPTPQRIQPTYH